MSKDPFSIDQLTSPYQEETLKTKIRKPNHSQRNIQYQATKPTNLPQEKILKTKIAQLEQQLKTLSDELFSQTALSRQLLAQNKEISAANQPLKDQINELQAQKLLLQQQLQQESQILQHQFLELTAKNKLLEEQTQTIALQQQKQRDPQEQLNILRTKNAILQQKLQDIESQQRDSALSTSQFLQSSQTPSILQNPEKTSQLEEENAKLEQTNQEQANTIIKLQRKISFLSSKKQGQSMFRPASTSPTENTNTPSPTIDSNLTQTDTLTLYTRNAGHELS